MPELPPKARGRGPHPLPVFLAMAGRRLANEPARLNALLEGLKRYQTAPPGPGMPAMRPLMQRGGVRLLSVGGPADGPLLVVVPSLINAPSVLDLAPDKSLIRYLAAQGHQVLLLDWGPMSRGERRLGLAGLITARLMPLLHRLPAPVSLLGYCMGGTLAIAAAQLLQARLRRLALIAAPWHFDGFSAEARTGALELWRTIRPLCAGLGAVPISMLNPLFWSLDEEAVLRKFEALSRRPVDDPEIGWFAAVEDWANSGAPLSIPAARDIFVKALAKDMTGRTLWRVGGQRIDPLAIAAPVLDVGATKDRIVPANARIRRTDINRWDVPSGHVGMIVGGSAPETLWQPLSNWLHGR